MTHKPRFIVLCGPTGVGKTKAPDKIFKLADNTYSKIEIDDLIVKNKIYTSTISTIIKNLSKELILKIINELDKDKHLLLTELFNQVYFNVKKNIIPCSTDNDSKNITCEQLHDKMLASSIDNKKTIVLEINGDKDFRWLFVDSQEYNGDDMKALSSFTNEHRETIRTTYHIEICYISYPYTNLLEMNKTRFLTNMEECNADSCSVRLGNFLLPNIYYGTITKIFEVYNELLVDNFFTQNNIKVSFYKRTSYGQYIKQNTFIDYQNSFILPAPVSTYPKTYSKVPSTYPYPWWKSWQKQPVKVGGRKTKKQKPKSKNQKAKTKKQINIKN